MARDKEQGRQKKKSSQGQQKEAAAMAEKRPKPDTDSSDSDSGPDDKNERPSKMSKSGSGVRKLKNEEGSTYFELDRNRRVTIRDFKNKIYVDIREFYEKDGKILPGKKGISLNTTQWNKLKTLIDDIDDEVQQLG